MTLRGNSSGGELSETLIQQGDKQKPGQLPQNWKPGQSGNPAGRPKGTRNKLQTDFFKALADDFAANGKVAIESVRKDDPSTYIKVVASLMPKELEITQPLQELTDEQLDAAFVAVRAILDAKNTGVGDSGQGEAQPASQLQAIPETS